MKTKKILTMISAVVMAAAMSVASLAGCNNGGGHTHAYQEVNGTREEATCTKPGKRTLKCVCGDAYEEEIPVDPDAHDYGEWEITKTPTDDETGRAVKKCANYEALSSKPAADEHTVEVTLPKLSEESKYHAVKVTQEATIIAEGVKRYEFAHYTGNVAFDVKIDKHTEIESIGDVVALAASLHGNIRSSSGSYSYGDPDGDDVSSHNFSNYYGDNYTRVHDEGDKRDFWYSLDDEGNPFGISAEVGRDIINRPENPDDDPEGWVPEYGEVRSDPRVDLSVTEENLLGYGYASGGGMRRTYGAEDTLQAYYNAARSSGAIKFDSAYEKKSDGSYVGSFEFSRKEQTHFCRYYVNFSTYPGGEIDTLSVQTKIIRTFMLASTFNGTNSGELIFDADGDVIFGEIYPISTETGSEEYEMQGNSIVTNGYKTKPDGTPLLDRFGNRIARPVPLGWEEGDPIEYYYEEGDRAPDGTYYDEDHPYIAIRTINFKQTLKVDGEEVEENPYPAESVYIRSFDVKYNGIVIAEDETVEIEANTPVLFDIDNVQPAETAKLDFDPLKVYLKDGAREIELSYTGDVDFGQNSYHIIGHFRATENKVFINSQYAGNITIILRTLSGKCERELKINVTKGKPSALKAQAYLYYDGDGVEEHNWEEINYDASNPETYITLYVGQTLYVRGVAIASEASYVDASFVTVFDTGDDTSPYITLEDGLELNGVNVSRITAVAASPANGAVGVYVNSVYTNGSGRPLAYKLIGVKVIQAPTVESMFTGSYSGTFNDIKMVAGGNEFVSADVTVTFGDNGKLDVKVTDGSNTVNCEYSYSYNAQTHALSCTLISGRDDDTFQFEFAVNEVYKLTITHPTFAGRSETIVLSRSQTN